MIDVGRERRMPKTRKSRYYFFLNPYQDCAFARCPKCETKTKIRKYCLLIHIVPHHLLSLNKTCHYCPSCDLIIVKKEEIENLLCAFNEQYGLDIIGNEYFIFGTIDRKDWRRVQQEKLDSTHMIKCLYPFKDMWYFEVEPGGWRYDPETKIQQSSTTN